MSRKIHTSRRISSIDRIARSLLLACSMVLSGCVMAAATENSSLSWIAWISLLPLFITIRVASPRVALFYGALWGFCLYLFSSVTSDAAATSTIHSIGLLAAVPAIYTYLGARMTRRIGYAPLVLAVGWIIVELALQPVALRQGLLASTQADGGLMRLVGGVMGYIFVAFLIAFVNAKLLSLVENIKLAFINLFVAPVVRHSFGWIYQRAVACYSAAYITQSQPRAPPVKHSVC